MLQFHNVCVFYKLIRQYQSHKTLTYIYIYDEDIRDQVLFIEFIWPLLMQTPEWSSAIWHNRKRKEGNSSTEILIKG